MSDPYLTHTASAGEISALIRGVQSSARTGLADPDTLALRVRAQLDKLDRVAKALGCQAYALSPSLMIWESPGQAAIMTFVQLKGEGRELHVEVRRGRPNAPNGVLALHILEKA